MKYVFVHSDFEEFLRACTGPSEMPERWRASRRVESGRSPWSGTRTFEKAIDLAVGGCPKLEAQVVRMADNILARMGLGSRDYSPVASYDVAGDEVDVSRYLEGEPECMRTWQTQEVWRPHGRIISITAQGSMACSVSKKAIALRGAAMLALVYAAEQAGYRVELNCAYTGGAVRGGSTSTSAVVVRVKDADQPADLSRLAFVFMHPASLRRLEFSYQETRDESYRWLFEVDREGGYGDAGKGADRALLTVPPCDMLLGSREWEHFVSEQKAALWALARAHEFGLADPSSPAAIGDGGQEGENNE